LFLIESFPDVQGISKQLRGAEVGADIELEFESDRVSLEIPLQGMTKKGWFIVPLVPPVVCMLYVFVT